jgi:dynein heavy chain
LFDAISRVTFAEEDRRLIIQISEILGGGDTETIELVDGVQCEGMIEDWLCRLEKDMQKSVKKACKDGLLSIDKRDLKPFTFDTPAQIALLGIQMQWTSQLENALSKTHKEKMQALDKERKGVQAVMDTLSEMCLNEMPASAPRLQRTKVETLVTIHVHQRDLFITLQDEAKQQRVRDNNDFDWTKNTRVYWMAETEDVEIRITDVAFTYSYEYLGAKERLCITPLTDRCYVTLSQALGMLYGGAPAGPAGTGKTETVKDLGRTLGICVIVTNCSDEHRYRDMAKIFKGLCQSGLWGCFDEFNRISLATLSVVAAQVESITTAKKQQLKEFQFPNETRLVRLKLECGYFITMNPGYAGRQELPENLKVQFRSVSMMVPNREVIMKVKLASVGYKEFDPLSKKFNVLYKLCEEQLSKQRHYDFGLRNILSVLRTAGNIKRSEPAGTAEEMIMARTLRDMNLSKLVAQDIPLFESLLRDIFPKQTNIPKKVYKDIEAACKEIIAADNLVPDFGQWFLKIIQLYETSLVRHGFMLVGPAGSGKTNIANTLNKARTKLGDIHKSVRLNPKSITGQQMYGVMNPVTGDWTPGVFSELWSKYNGKNYNKQFTWLTCDGPVDAIWIENLNTVLDDNKILTLANSDRIPMADNVRMVFEVENLDNASPATVSRCGIVYVSESDLSWEPLCTTWARDRTSDKVSVHPDEAQFLADCVEKYMGKPQIFTYLVKNQNYVMYTPPVIRTNQTLNLLTSVLQLFQESGHAQVDKSLFEKIFTYCLAWGVGGLFETEEREKFQKYLEGRNAPLPQISAQRMSVDKETVYDYYVDPNTKDWKGWEAEQWQQPKRIIFSQLLIPTLDSTRAEFIVDRIAKLPRVRNREREEAGNYHTMLVGGPGTAKTSICLMYSSKFDKDEMLFKRINFSSATSPWNFQEAVEGELEKKQGKTYHPLRGKKLTVFIDDASMPYVNTWGDQVTLEIARQLIELKGMYFLDKDNRGNLRSIESLQFIGAMNHPGGGRNDIPHRMKRHFFSFNMPAPSTRSIENIYGRILDVLFNPKKYADDGIKSTKALLTDTTIALWDQVKRRLLPTPAKFHYVFNMRELSRVFQGICTVVQKPEYRVLHDCLALKEKMPPALFLAALWRHECTRVFEDKLVNEADKKVFHDLMDKTTKDKFRDLSPDDETLLTELQFCDFMREDKFDEYGDLLEPAPFVYEAVPDRDYVRKIVMGKLEIYNEKFPAKKMNLVIFDDALGHLLRLTRIINTPSGNALLVGVGGSGKQSLTKLSSSICKQSFFQITLTKSYNLGNLREDLRQLYELCGPGGGSATFILTDAEIKNEDFLESMNSMLATGEVAGVIAKEDKDTFALSSKTHWSKEVGVKGYDPTTLELWIYAINRVRDCLHTVLSFSPVGSKFRERARKFPALFSTCTVDWFLPWPEEALVSVSGSFLADFTVDCSSETKTGLKRHMGKVHDMVTEVCGLYFQRMRRHVYVTPKSYLSFIEQYKAVYRKKHTELEAEEQNIGRGLIKLAEAAEGVEVLKVNLREEEVELNHQMKKANALLKNLEVESAKAQKKSEEVAVVKESCDEERAKIGIERAAADRDLAQALPYLEKAKQAANSIQPKDIGELKSLKQPAEICRLILDSVHILFQKPLIPVGPRVVNFRKLAPLDFIMDSFEYSTKATLQHQTFLN